MNNTVEPGFSKIFWETKEFYFANLITMQVDQQLSKSLLIPGSTVFVMQLNEVQMKPGLAAAPRDFKDD